MNTPRNKRPHHQTVRPQPKQQVISSRPHQPNVAQPKNAVAAPSVTRHAAPTPVVAPRATPHAARPQGAGPSRQRADTAATPAHPQPSVRALQTKMRAPQPPANPPGRAPAVPPAYRPQPVPKVLQTKVAGAQPRRTAVSPHAAARPSTPSGRPTVPTHRGPDKVVQRMMRFSGFPYKLSETFKLIYNKQPTNKQQLIDQAIKEITEPSSVNTHHPAHYKWNEYFFRKIGNNEGLIGWKEEEYDEKSFEYLEKSEAASKMEKL